MLTHTHAHARTCTHAHCHFKALRRREAGLAVEEREDETAEWHSYHKKDRSLTCMFVAYSHLQRGLKGEMRKGRFRLDSKDKARIQCVCIHHISTPVLSVQS